MGVQTARRQILLIDRPLTAALLKQRLFSHRFNVASSVSDTASVLEALNSCEVDLILWDLSLPDVEPEEILDWIKNHRPDLPCLAFGGSETEAKALGLSSWLPKPTPLMELHPWKGQGLHLMEQIHQIFGMERTIKVMLVDDAALMIHVLNQILDRDKNLEVTVRVNNGEEALQALQEHQPDVILLDIEMPVMDGLTFLKHARAHSQARVIILSSVAMEGSPKAAEARRLGADAVLAKPSGAVSLNLASEKGQDILNTIYAVLRAES